MTASKAFRVAVAIGSALVLSLQSPPLNWHLLQWFSLVPMLLVLDRRRLRFDVWLGYLYGVVGVAALFRWLVATIDLFSNLPTIAALALLLLFSSVFGAPYALLWGSVHPLRERLGTWWVLAWPALWVLLEYASMTVFLFPYNHGVGQYRVPLTWQVIGVTGIWGLTFQIFFVNATLAEWLFRLRAGDREPPGFAMLGASASLLAVVAYGSYRYEAVEQALREAPVLRTGQIQSRVGMDERMVMGGREILVDWLEKTEPIVPGTVDLVVWPEGASPYPLNALPGKRNTVRDRLQKLAVDGQFDLIVGGGTRYDEPGGGRAVYNTVYGFHAHGGEPAFYHKLIPLPFGEYMPLGDWFPGLADAIGGIGDFRAGSEPTVIALGGRRYAAPICYEAILPRTCRSFERPDLFVNVTNDAWFGDTAAPHQHAMLAATRATELGVPMFRSAYTGVSMVIEPHGVIYAETPVFEPVARLVEVRQTTVPTLYGRYGDWFVALCGLGLVGAGVATRRSTG